MKKRLSWSVLIFILAIGLMAGPAVAKDILIGIMVPTTGSEATYGKDMENAISLAVDERFRRCAGSTPDQ